MNSDTHTRKRKTPLILLISLFFLSLTTNNIAHSYQNTFLPFHQHAIASLQTNGEYLEFDDGSIWKVHPSYQYQLRKWHSGDTIEISQSTSDFRGNYRFWITNKTVNSYVLADIFQGPILDHYCTQHLANANQDLIYLSSGSGIETTWIADSRDAYLVSQWKPGQTIIVGVNNSWFNWFSGSHILLYNVEKNNFIRARSL